MMFLHSALLALLCTTGSNAIESPSNNNNGNGPNYSLSRQISFDPLHDEIHIVEEGSDEITDTATPSSSSSSTPSAPAVQFLNIYGDEHSSTQNDPTRKTSSSNVLFQGASSLSGGAFVAMAECSFIPKTTSAASLMSDFDYEEDFEDDEDDDDDDQDDGHSSMLSNASLRKSRVIASANGVASSNSYSGDDSGSSGRNSSTSRSSTRPSLSSYGVRKPTALHMQKKMTDPLTLLKLRGGDIAETASTVASAAAEAATTAATTTTAETVAAAGATAATAASAITVSDEFLKRLIVASLVTLLYEGSIGHIFEFLKIAMQTAPIGTTYLSIINSITSSKGVSGLWDGFLPWGVVQAIFKGGVFGLAHAVAKAHIMPLVDAGILPKQVGLTLAGGIAGGFQGYILSPTLLLKTRVMTNPVFRESMSVLRTTLLSFTIGIDVVREEGLLALMKGSNIFALKRVFDWSTRYFFADAIEAFMVSNVTGGVALTAGQKITASLLGGTLSTIVTLPLDVIVAKSQDAKKAGVSVSAWDTFMKDYREGGWKGLYDANMMGFEVRLLHVCFTTVVMKTGSAIMYDFLYGGSK